MADLLLSQSGLSENVNLILSDVQNYPKDQCIVIILIECDSDVQQLTSLRISLFSHAAKHTDFPGGYLIRRVQRSKGKPLMYKLAEDCHTLALFIQSGATVDISPLITSSSKGQPNVDLATTQSLDDSYINPSTPSTPVSQNNIWQKAVSTAYGDMISKLNADMLSFQKLIQDEISDIHTKYKNQDQNISDLNSSCKNLTDAAKAAKDRNLESLLRKQQNEINDLKANQDRLLKAAEAAKSRKQAAILDTDKTIQSIKVKKS